MLTLALPLHHTRSVVCVTSRSGRLACAWSPSHSGRGPPDTSVILSGTVPGSCPHTASGPCASQRAGCQYCAVSGVRAPCLSTAVRRHQHQRLSSFCCAVCEATCAVVAGIMRNMSLLQDASSHTHRNTTCTSSSFAPGAGASAEPGLLSQLACSGAKRCCRV